MEPTPVQIQKKRAFMQKLTLSELLLSTYITKADIIGANAYCRSCKPKGQVFPDLIQGDQINPDYANVVCAFAQSLETPAPICKNRPYLDSNWNAYHRVITAIAILGQCTEKNDQNEQRKAPTRNKRRRD